MTKKIYWLHVYYEVLPNQLVGLVYKEDPDPSASPIRLIIGKRRIVLAENIDPKSCHLLFAERNANTYTLKKIFKYQKITPNKYKDTYELNIPDILTKYSIDYEQLSKEKYQKIRRKKRVSETVDICYTGIIKEDYWWSDMHIYDFDADYFPNKVKIGKTDILKCSVRSFYNESHLYNYFKNIRKPLVLGVEEFKELVDLIYITGSEYSIYWDKGCLKRCNFDSSILTFFHPNETSQDISFKFPLKNEHTAKIFYDFIQCDTYDSAKKLFTKMKVLQLI